MTDRCVHVQVPDHLEPGLDDRQLTRLLGLDLQDSSSSASSNSTPAPEKTKPRNAAVTDLTPEEVGVLFFLFIILNMLC